MGMVFVDWVLIYSFSDIEDEEIQKVLAELEEYGDMCCLEAQCGRLNNKV